MTQTNVSNMPIRPDGVKPKIAKDFTKEYVLVNGYSVSQHTVLSPTADDVELEVGLETYDNMENDTAIAKIKSILITNVLADDLQMSPGATEEQVGKAEYDVYVFIMEFCQRVLGGLDRPYRETLEQQFGNALKYGHGIAETEWEYRMDGSDNKPPDAKTPKVKKSRLSAMLTKFGLVSAEKDEDVPDGTGIKRPQLKSQKIRLMPKSIKVKPRGSVQFVVDEFMNVLGMTPKNRKYAGSNSLAWDEIIDRDKFLVLTIKKQDEDPRGKSSYRPAVNWFKLKAQLPAEMFRFVLEEAVPKAVGTLPEKSIPYEFERDEDGNVVYDDPGTNKSPRMMTAAESFARQIQGFRGGSGAVIPWGAKLEPYKKGLTGANDAQLFRIILKIINDEMENAILLQTLAQSEGEHQARSASQQVAELLYNLTFWYKWLLGQMTLYDLFEVAIRINFGEWAIRYMPIVSLGDFVRRDWTEELKGYADAYFKGLLDDTQRPEIMANLNLPKPGPSRQELDMEAAAKADVNGEAVPNPNKRPDKKAGANRNKGNGTEKKNDTKSIADTRFGPNHVLGHNRGWFSRNIRTVFSGRK